MRAHARVCVRMCVVALVPAHVCVRQWASDFLQYRQDDCLVPPQLLLGTRRLLDLRVILPCSRSRFLCSQSWRWLIRGSWEVPGSCAGTPERTQVCTQVCLKISVLQALACKQQTFHWATCNDQGPLSHNHNASINHIITHLCHSGPCEACRLAFCLLLLLLHAFPLLFGLLQLGRLSAAPPFAVALLLFPLQSLPAWNSCQTSARTFQQVKQVLQVLGLGLDLGLGRGRGFLRLSLFTHPQNLVFAYPGQPRSLKKYILNDTGTTPEGKER